MFLQARRTVHVLRWEAGGIDAHGNPVEGWSDPEAVRVYGWEVPRTAEPLVTGHDRVTVDVSIFVPPSFPIRPAARARRCSPAAAASATSSCPART